MLEMGSDPNQQPSANGTTQAIGRFGVATGKAALGEGSGLAAINVQHVPKPFCP
jgi:hypothetical protein